MNCRVGVIYSTSEYVCMLTDLKLVLIYTVQHNSYHLKIRSVAVFTVDAVSSHVDLTSLTELSLETSSSDHQSNMQHK